MENKIKKNQLSAMNYYYRNYSREYFLNSVKSNGLKNFELWTCPQHFHIDSEGYENTELLKKQVADRGLKIICLTPQQGNPNPYNLAARGDNLKEESFSYFKNVVDVAKKLDVSMISLNPGWDYYDESPRFAWKRSVLMIQEIAKYAEDKEVKIVVEALQPDESHLVNSILDLEFYLYEIQNNNVYVNLDLGAMARNNETISQYFTAFGKRIKHCHFVDGNPVGHLQWGEGTRNPDSDIQVFNQQDYEGYFTFEFAQSKYFLNPSLVEEKAIDYLGPFLK